MLRLIAVAVVCLALFPTEARARHRFRVLTTAECAPGWTTVDTFIAPGDIRAGASGLVVAPSEIYVVGSTWPSLTTSSWIVRRSKTGANWETVDQVFTGTDIGTAASGVARGDGMVYVVGSANVVGSQRGPWLVRGSDDDTLWGTLDVVEDPNLPSARADAIAIDSAGSVLVGGASYDSTAGQHRWRVRQSDDLGLSWTDVDEVEPTSTATGVYALAADPASDVVYAAGYDWVSTRYVWKVRKREGGVWSAVDTFQLDSGPTVPVNGSVPAAAVVGENGAVFVVGSAFDGSGQAHWIVRRSMNRGASWETVDDPFGSMQRCVASGVGYQQNRKRLFVTGRCSDGTGYRWLTRLSVDGGDTWSTDDSFRTGPGLEARGADVDAAPNGRVFAAGAVVGSDGRLRWVVRRRNDCE